MVEDQLFQLQKDIFVITRTTLINEFQPNLIRVATFCCLKLIPWNWALVVDLGHIRSIFCGLKAFDSYFSNQFWIWFKINYLNEQLSLSVSSEYSDLHFSNSHNCTSCKFKQCSAYHRCLQVNRKKIRVNLDLTGRSCKLKMKFRWVIGTWFRMKLVKHFRFVTKKFFSNYSLLCIFCYQVIYW